MQNSGGLKERGDDGAQKRCQPAQQQAEVVAGGCDAPIDPVTVAALEVIATHAVREYTRGGRLGKARATIR
jgi:hypothetical protein